MFTILRWWKNPDVSSTNAFISRTLGKISIINNTFKGPRPAEGEEFWLSDVTNEIFPSQVKGCFLAEPFKKYKLHDLFPLDHLTCTIQHLENGRIVIVNPVKILDKQDNIIPWIIPKDLRNRIMADKRVVATIVNLGGELWIKNFRKNESRV